MRAPFNICYIFCVLVFIVIRHQKYILCDKFQLSNYHDSVDTAWWEMDRPVLTFGYGTLKIDKLDMIEIWRCRRLKDFELSNWLHKRQFNC